MRISGGEAKGRVLKSPGGKGTRPTDSRCRETLFDIIGARVVGAAFLDLYAGTGAVGIEAMSRGAEKAVFVEANPGVCAIVRDNLKTLGYTERSAVWPMPVRAGLARLVALEAGFDIMFAGPPFIRVHELDELCAALDNSAQLLHNGNGRFEPILVIQHHRKDVPLLSNFRLVQERRTGESVLSFFELSTGILPERGGTSH